MPAPDSAAPPVQVVTDTFPLAIEEFCARLSKTDKRVELIGGFYHSEKSAGRLRDTAAKYSDRYAQFANLPA